MSIATPEGKPSMYGDPSPMRYVYLRVKQVAKVLGMSESTVWRFCHREGSDFPKPYRLTDSCTAWRSDEIAEWMNSRQKMED